METLSIKRPSVVLYPMAFTAWQLVSSKLTREHLSDVSLSFKWSASLNQVHSRKSPYWSIQSELIGDLNTGIASHHMHRFIILKRREFHRAHISGGRTHEVS